jgi:transcription factor TGA
MYNKGIASLPLGNCHVENWADSGMADNSQQTDDTSTDIDTDDKNQVSSINFSNMFYFF